YLDRTGNRKFWTADKIVGLSAMFISLMTLVIFIRQTNIIEEQSHLSVLPYLMMETSNDSELGRFKIDIENQGVGPAIIESRVILYKNELFDMEFADFLKQNIPAMDSVETINVSTLQQGLAISAGAKRNVLTVGGSRESYLQFLQIMQQLDEEGFDYRIQYRSIYNDSWTISSDTDVPTPVD
ncbi:MAG: hypothetical protein AAF466_14095, partial [Bacteroidota bacterium]